MNNSQYINGSPSTERLQFKIREGRKWLIDIYRGEKRLYSTAIPPKGSGERIDFIDRNFKYHFGYTGAISHGILIHIKDGKATLKAIPFGTLKRLKSYFI